MSKNVPKFEKGLRHLRVKDSLMLASWSYQPSLEKMLLERNSKFLPEREQGANYQGGINFENFEFVFHIMISLELEKRGHKI